MSFLNHIQESRLSFIITFGSGNDHLTFLNLTRDWAIALCKELIPEKALYDGMYQIHLP